MQPPDGMIRVLEIHEKNKETGMVEVRYAAPGHEPTSCIPPDGVVYRYPIGAVGFIDCYPILPSERISEYEKMAALALAHIFDPHERAEEQVGHA